MATSASVHTNTYGGRTITLTVEETGTSIENNTSTVKWTLTSGTSSTYHDVYQVTAWVGGTADSNKVYGPKTATWDTRAFPCKDGSTSGTIPIPHNADGTASDLFFRLRGSVKTNSPQNYDGSINLTTIPRASSFTISKTSGGSAATSWNLGENLYVNITRASNTFTHKVYYVVNNSGNISISNSAQTSANTTLASSLAQYIPSSSATATIYVDTYSGSTKIGSSSKTFTINVPSSYIPSISSVTKSDTTNNFSTHGAYVQGKSNLRVQTSANGNYSTITNYTVRLKNSGGTVLNTKTGNDVTFSNISYTGTITVEVVVTDSRNRQATNSSTITVASYENPKITTFNAERRNNDSTITVTMNGEVTNINNHNSNTKYFRLYAREKGTSDWGNRLIDYSSNYTYVNNSYTVTKDEDKSWEFLFQVGDSYTVTTKTVTVGTAFELMNWKADGTAMAIGKVSEKSNSLEIALNTEFTNDLWLKSGDFQLSTPNSSSDDSRDIVFRYGNGQEKARFWCDNDMTTTHRIQMRSYDSSGNALESSTLSLVNDIKIYRCADEVTVPANSLNSYNLRTITIPTGYKMIGILPLANGYADQWLVSYGFYGSNTIRAMIHSKFNSSLTNTLVYYLIFLKQDYHDRVVTNI